MTTENKDDNVPVVPSATPGQEHAPETPARKPRRRAWRFFVTLLLLLVLAGLAAGGWYGWQWLQQQRAMEASAAQAQQARIAALEESLRRLERSRASRDALGELQDELAGTRESLQQELARVFSELEGIRETARGGRRDLVLAEVEYLLRVAADTLYLSGDTDTAIYALQSADDRLRQLAEPRFRPVRERISDHLQALAAVSTADIDGMTLKLGSMMRQVASLPLKQTQHARAAGTREAQDQSESTWARFKAGLDRVFRKLVVVQRAEPPPPLLTPEQHFMLYRNVELQLSTARAALMAGEAEVYRQSLELAREWLTRYFDTRDMAVANAIADIGGLLEMPLQPALPDIHPALDEFRRIVGDSRRTGAFAE